MPRSLNERMEKRALSHGSLTGQQPSRPTGQDSSPPSPLKTRLAEAASAATDAAGIALHKEKMLKAHGDYEAAREGK